MGLVPYKFAELIHLQFPSSSDLTRMAGLACRKSHRHLNVNLTLRKQENTSAVRAHVFNKIAVNDLFNNLEGVRQYLPKNVGSRSACTRR